jgi:hypothetical protein
LADDASDVRPGWPCCWPDRRRSRSPRHRGTTASRHYKEITSRIICAPHRPPRSVIDQAIGILMAHQHCGPDEAFGLVRAMSQRRNIKLREVGANLVTPIQDRA